MRRECVVNRGSGRKGQQVSLMLPEVFRLMPSTRFEVRIRHNKTAFEIDGYRFESCGLVISLIVLANNVFLLQLRLRLNAEFEGDLARYKVNPAHTITQVL